MTIKTLELYDAVNGVPNNRLPLVIYQQIIPPATDDPAAWLEQKFAANQWPAQWRYGIYDYTHYHANCHELLGVFAGHARVQLGGDTGPVVEISPGDVLLIPAGVGHKALETSDDFQVVGAYPEGTHADLCRDDPTTLARNSERIAALPLPATDPVYGAQGGITTLWHNAEQA